MRKKVLFICFALWVCCNSICAQENMPQAISPLQSYADRLEKFGKSLPQEQIFIHMDNSCYFLGDTLFFKAYVQRSYTQAPSGISRVLYAELFNQDGYLVERQCIALKNGMGVGSFCLQDSLYAGFYELRAYTRWQLNWGLTSHSHTHFAEQWFFNKRMAQFYYRDYDKLYSRVFPVYDKPTTPGEFYHDMTLRPLRRIYKADHSQPKASITCYPEGGNLVSQTLCYVALEANDLEGMHLEGTFQIMNKQDEVVTMGKTDSRGRALFTLTPDPNQTYIGEFTCNQQTTSFRLPQVETDACAVHVAQRGQQVDLRIQPMGRASAQPLGYTLMHQGRVLHFAQLTQGDTLVHTLDASSWPSGVIQLTVFNEQGRIYADRLFFHKKERLLAQNLSFIGIQPQYAPFDSIQINVEGGLPQSELSISVCDAAHTEYLYDDASILSELLLCSQIKGFVENPNYYFEANDSVHNHALDLLLMIQGWRRYDWKLMVVPHSFTLSHAPELTPELNGEVNTYHTQTRENLLDPSENLAQSNETESTISTETNSVQEKSISLHESLASTSASTQDARDRFEQKTSNLKREVLVHAEFTKPGAPEGILGEMMTINGQFCVQTPRFYEQCYFFLAASDSTKWKKGYTHTWVREGEDKNQEPHYPEFYVKLQPIYPRFVKPYTWYQCNLAPIPQHSVMHESWMNDGSRTLGTVLVGARRTIQRKLDASKPAFVIDAYQAFNEVCDAGFCQGVYLGFQRFATDISRTYIGDMNMERQYPVEIRLDKHTQGYFSSEFQRNQYNHLPMLDKVYVYTDYSPRLEGNKKFEQSNQPTVTVDFRLIPNEGRRTTYRDRRYVLQGFAVCEEFYNPQYSQKPLPSYPDHRRTLYWNPSVQLDEQGCATIRCYNNNKQTQVVVRAEGWSADGHLLTGRSYPENRK